MNAGGGGLTNTAATLLTIDTTGITVASGGTFTLSTTAAGGITQTAAALISGAGGLRINNTSTGVTTLAAGEFLYRPDDAQRRDHGGEHPRQRRDA